jgi:hypothetical protein
MLYLEKSNKNRPLYLTTHLSLHGAHFLNVPTALVIVPTFIDQLPGCVLRYKDKAHTHMVTTLLEFLVTLCQTEAVVDQVSITGALVRAGSRGNIW